MSKITVAIIGLGGRGRNCFGAHALKYPNEMQVVAVAEPDLNRREVVKEAHGLSEDMCYDSWEKLLEQPRLADAVIIATQDSMHFKPAVKALEAGYHILLEKPMSNDPRECVIIGELAKKHDRVLSVAHGMRYSAFMSTIKQLLEEGRIGRLMSIQHNENVAWWHMAHSFVRGNWRNSIETSPMILAKSCHDMDIILWLAGQDCLSVSSYGELSHFRKEEAPEDAPERCTDGCPHAEKCIYNAERWYLSEKLDFTTRAMSIDQSLEARTKALKEGPYGRCVYHCDNDVVDHQVTTLLFENGITAAFTMCGFTSINNRTLKLMGTKGEIRGAMHLNEIEVNDFLTGRRDVIHVKTPEGDHQGADTALLHDFARLVASDGKQQGKTGASGSVQGHIMSFAAEKSRVEKRIIDMKEYMQELQG